MITAERLRELEAEHPDTIIVGTFNRDTKEQTLVAMPRRPETIARLQARFGLAEELHGGMIYPYKAKAK